MRRFERITYLVEPVEEYRHGGYHPVRLHDVFDNRYEVIGKLAFGQFSTVWLAKDQKKDGQQVTLKILKADASKDSKELSVLLSISSSDMDHPGKKHVLELLDHFYHTGPNGTHLCLVLPLMISDGEAMTVTHIPHKAEFVRGISRQALLGADFLHQLGIVHCDIQPANILISPAETMDIEERLRTPKFGAVKWLDGVVQDDSAPEYLMPSQRPSGLLNDVDFSTLEIKIGDLGGAQWIRERDQKPVTPLGFRPPELIHQRNWDMNLDIWALGCVLFQFATNEHLFQLATLGHTHEEIDEEHDSLIHQRFGPDDSEDGDFSGYLKERLPDNFGDGNAESLASFLLLMLQPDPERRIAAKDLPKTGFISDGS